MRTALATHWQEIRTSEPKLIRTALVASAVIHLLTFGLYQLGIFRWAPPAMDEWEMDATLSFDIDMKPSSQDAIQAERKAEEAKVSERLLPQLPKQFAIEETKPEAEDAVAEDSTKKAETPAEVQAQKSDAVTPKTDEEEANRIKKEEALKRLALEKLRREQKTDKESATVIDRFKTWQEEYDKLQGEGLAANGLAGKSVDRYTTVLRKAIHRNYTLPEAYNFKDSKLTAVIAVSIDGKGSLMSTQIHQSSGDAVFDQLAFKAVESTAPFPEPPSAIVGQVLYLTFTPASL